jgi:LmbE family N-acetylglucosaminyl deacetylase
MDFDDIVNELRVQQRRINAALVALVGTAQADAPVTQPAPKITATPNHRTTRRSSMSSGVKRKISLAMKQNWASRKPKLKLSPEIKSKISSSQKARWASIKAAAQQMAA